MKFRALCLALCGLAVAAFAFAACTKGKPAPLLGLWESTYRGRGGESNTLEFKSDSVFTKSNVKASEFHYASWGDSLRVVRIIPDSLKRAGDTLAPEYAMSFLINGDTLELHEKARTEWLVRSGDIPETPASILGTWKTVRSTDALSVNGFKRFRPDSILQARVPFGDFDGSYTRTNDSMVMYLAADTSRCALSLRGDTLELTRTFANGTYSFRYLRAGTHTWYRFEEK